VERAGTAVAGAHRDALMTIFMIDHNGMSLEAFGVVSRLWKTQPLGAGGLRNIALMDDCVVGEAWQASGEWLAWSFFTSAVCACSGRARRRMRKSRRMGGD
jgi:hypothetical protein